MTPARRWTAVIVGIAVSALLLLLAVRDVDGARLQATLAAARWWIVVPFLASLFAYYWVKTVRWSVLLHSVAQVHPGFLFAPVMVGYAAGALLPMQLGEVVRGWLGAKRLQIRVATVLMSIALERVFDLLSILLLAVLAFGMATTNSAWLSSAIIVLALGTLVLLALFLLFVFRTGQCLTWSERALAWMPARFRERVLDHLHAAAGGLGALRSGKSICFLLVLSSLQWLFMFGCIWLSLYAMHIEVSAVPAALVTVFTVIGISLPNSPGYVGSIQLAFTLALEPFGIGPAEAVAASLFFHVLAYLSVVVCGFSLLPALGIRMHDITRRMTVGTDQT